jgi:hypothetical protein
MKNTVVYDRGDKKIQLPIHEDDLWLTQNQISEIYGIGKESVSKHISKIYKSNEQDEARTCNKIKVTAQDGKEYTMNHYSLDIVLAIGYRVNSAMGTEFRKWATKVLSEFRKNGFAVSPNITQSQFEVLREKISEIRTSESTMYRKVTDVFALTSYDYNSSSKEARDFFATAQNAFHYAATEKTAAEIIATRCDSDKEQVGMVAIDKYKKPTKKDVKIAKNYMSEKELKLLTNISEQFLMFADTMALTEQKMTMNTWIFKLWELIRLNELPVLFDQPNPKGSISKAKADKFAIAQLEKYKNKLTTTEKKSLGLK